VFEDYYMTFYNMIFTALPITAKAILESDINYKSTKIPDAKKYLPYIYYVG